MARTSGRTLNMAALFAATYERYTIVLVAVRPATGCELRIRLSWDGS